MFSVIRRRPTRSEWIEIAGVAALIVLSAGLYFWALSRNGMGNSYYAAAVKSATVSWKAFLFGSLDPGSFITVDKPPFAFWIQALSCRVFGFSSWAMLAPQALAGVATVVMVYLIVKRWMGKTAGMIAGLVMALTPIAVVIFRFNNPDAMLTFLLVASAWAFWSALRNGSTWKMVICGALVGLAFTTKMLEALIVVPAFVAVYLVFSRRRVIHRFLQILAAGGALLVGAGWWVLVAVLWPSASRPYIGGTSDNSVISLIFSRTAGYLSSSSQGGGFAGPGGGGGFGFSGPSGWLRIFNQQMGGQISWLLPLAVLGLAAGVCLYWRHARKDKDLRLAGFLMWGIWTLSYVGVFSFASGVVHPYYTVVLAPSIAALVGGGSIALWRVSESRRWLAWMLPAGIAGSAYWSFALLRRSSAYSPKLSLVILIAGAVIAVGLILVLARLVNGRVARYGLVGAAAVCVMAGPSIYAHSTISRSVTGSFAAAGPLSSASMGGGVVPTGNAYSQLLKMRASSSTTSSSSASTTSTTVSTTASSTTSTTTARSAYGPPSGFTPPAGFTPPSGNFTPPAGFTPPTGMGPLGANQGENVTVDSRLIKYLQAHKGTAKYLVAVQSSNSAVPFILQTGEPVMAMGGFSGSDPCPTLAQFKKMVAAGEVHYVWVSGGNVGGVGPGGGDAQSVMSWVTSNGKAVSSTEYGGSSSGGTLYRVG